MKRFLPVRALGALVLPLVLPSSMQAQSSIRFVEDGREAEVAGLLGEALVQARDGKYFPVPVGAEFKITEASDFVEERGEFDYWYGITAAPDDGTPAGGKVGVKFTEQVDAAGRIEHLYSVRAWIHDGRVTHLSHQPVMGLESNHHYRREEYFLIDRDEADGFLWCGLFKGGRPVLMLRGRSTKAEQVRLAAAVDRGDGEAVAGALADGARWEQLEETLQDRLAGHGQLDWLQAWAARSRGWQKRKGPNLLWAAVAAGRADTVKWLLEQGVDPERPNRHEKSLLGVAIETRRIEILEMLLQGRSGKWDEEADDLHPLQVAALTGQREIVTKLLAAGLKWPTRTRGYQKAFATAVTQRSAPAARLLMDSGVFDARDGGYDRVLGIALSRAAWNGDVEVVRALLTRGVNWDGLAKIDLLPLRAAVERNRVDVMNLLIESGASPQQLVYDRNWDLVSVALRNGHVEAADRLLELGVDPITLKRHQAELWQRALAAQNEGVGAWLRVHEVGLGNDRAKASEMVRAAIEEGYLPLLQEAQRQGWKPTDDLGGGWTVAALAHWHGLTEPVEWIGTAEVEGGPTPLVSARGLQVLQRVSPAFPEKFWDAEEPGEAVIQVLIDPQGRVSNARVVEASAVEYGRAARRALLQWRFSPLEAGAQGWRRVKVPVGFTAMAETDEFVPAHRLDRAPVAVKMPRVQPPAGVDATRPGLAWMSVLVDDTGEVIQARVDMITDEAWRSAIEAAVKRWVFQPGVKGERTVRTGLRLFVRFPTGEVLPEDGLPVQFAVGPSERLLPAVLRYWDRVKVSREELPGGGLALVQLTVKANGRPADIEIVAASQDGLAEACQKSIRHWLFNPARRDGKVVDQQMLMPIVLQP